MPTVTASSKLFGDEDWISVIFATLMSCSVVKCRRTMRYRGGGGEMQYRDSVYCPILDAPPRSPRARSSHRSFARFIPDAAPGTRCCAVRADVFVRARSGDDRTRGLRGTPASRNHARARALESRHAARLVHHPGTQVVGRHVLRPPRRHPA